MDLSLSLFMINLLTHFFCSQSTMIPIFNLRGYCSVVIHVKKPLNYRCHMGTYWIILVVCLHALHVAVLVGFTGAIRHIEFRFDELRDLWQGILISASVIGTFLSRFHTMVTFPSVCSAYVAHYIIITDKGIHSFYAQLGLTRI